MRKVNTLLPSLNTDCQQRASVSTPTHIPSLLVLSLLFLHSIPFLECAGFHWSFYYLHSLITVSPFYPSRFTSRMRLVFQHSLFLVEPRFSDKTTRREYHSDWTGCRSSRQSENNLDTISRLVTWRLVTPITFTFSSDTFDDVSPATISTIQFT